MSILHANLRLLRQRPSLWTLYACTCLMVGFGVLFEWTRLHTASLSATAVLFPVLAAGVLPIGQIVAMMQVEILSCPFALTLPGVQSVVRQVIFIVGFVVSLVATLIVPRDNGPAGHAILTLLATFSASLTVYLVGAGLTYVLGLPGLILAVFGWFMVLLDFKAGLGVDAAYIVLDFPIPVIMTAVLSAAIVWSCLGRPPWRIRIAPPLRQGLSGRPDHDRVKGRKSVDFASDRFLLERVRTARHLSSAQYVWGTLYAWLVPGGGGRIQLILTIATALVCGAFAWYLPMVAPILIMMTSFDSPSTPLLYSSLLIAGGRRERFLGTLVSLIIAGIVWTVSIALSFTALDLVQPYLAPSGMRATSLEEAIAPLGIRLAVSLTAVYPLLTLMDLALGRSSGAQAMRIVLVVLLSQPIVFARYWLTGIPLVWIALALTMSWLVCAYGLYWTTMRRDLVSGRPEKAERSWLGTTRRLAELRRGQR